MKPITTQDALRAAKRGRRAAIECSLDHWLNLRERKIDDIGYAEICWSRCALCERYLGNRARLIRPTPCPLSDRMCEGGCIVAWYAAQNALQTRNQMAFEKAADRIIRKLRELLK